MIQLIWDDHRRGTATAPSCRSVTVGEGANFSPEDLLAMAGASCLMRTFLQLTEEAGIPILGFTATASLDSADVARPSRVHVQSYVVAPQEACGEDLDQLFTAAVRTSPIARLLENRLAVTSEIRILCSAHTEALHAPLAALSEC